MLLTVTICVVVIVASMLASIEEIDGGLIALTRFTGEIGFYPQEYLEIIRLYVGE